MRDDKQETSKLDDNGEFGRAPRPTVPARRSSTSSVLTNAGSNDIQSQISEVLRSQGATNHRVAVLEGLVTSIEGYLKTFDSDYQHEQQKSQEMNSQIQKIQSDVTDLDASIVDIRNQFGFQDMNIDRNIKQVTDAIQTAYGKHLTVAEELKTADNDTARTNLAQDAADTKTAYQELVREYLELIVGRDMGTIDESNLRTQVRTLHARLVDQLEKPLVKPASRWGALFSNDVNAKAVKAVTRLSANPALATKGKSDVELQVNIDVLTLMMHAVFVLEQQSKKPNAASQQPVNGVDKHTPTKPSPELASHFRSPTANGLQNISESARILNDALLTTLHDDLAAIKTRADGLIGSQDKNWQFWGNVLKAIAVIILATLATAAFMSFAGFTAPAFMLNVATTVKANTMIATVLNLVAAKLGVDLNVAAGVAVLGAATTFGVFGKLTHMVGAPSRYKQDLDRAVNATDAALPTALPMTPRM